jgi:hypothetical protein
VAELTTRARAAGTVHPDITVGDVLALVWAMRGLIQTAGDVAPDAWQRFLDIHLAGLRSAVSPSDVRSLSNRQLSALTSRSRS